MGARILAILRKLHGLSDNQGSALSGGGIAIGLVGVAFLIMLAVQTPRMVRGVGIDSPPACSAMTGNVDNPTETTSVQIDAGTGNTIDEICIKTGESAFAGDLKHSGVITSDGSYGLSDCYTVSGIGTQVVTVTSGEGCHAVSHLDFTVVIASTETPIPPTETLVPPTETLVPPTETLVPPTETLVPPTETLVPPTETLVPPTETLVPPTETLVPPTETLVPPTETLVPGLTSEDLGSLPSNGTGGQSVRPSLRRRFLWHASLLNGIAISCSLCREAVRRLSAYAGGVLLLSGRVDCDPGEQLPAAVNSQPGNHSADARPVHRLAARPRSVHPSLRSVAIPVALLLARHSVRCFALNPRRQTARRRRPEA